MPKRILKKGLLFAALRIDVQVVKNAHRTSCKTCGERPEGSRLYVKQGTGRGQKTAVYCSDCGSYFLRVRKAEMDRASERLNGSDITVRFIDGEFEGIAKDET